MEDQTISTVDTPMGIINILNHFSVSELEYILNMKMIELINQNLSQINNDKLISNTYYEGCQGIFELIVSIRYLLCNV